MAFEKYVSQSKNDVLRRRDDASRREDDVLRLLNHVLKQLAHVSRQRFAALAWRDYANARRSVAWEQQDR